MDCYYINLACETEKRLLLEKNFEQHNTLNWSLQRFEALDKIFVVDNKVQGQLSEGAKGCFLSHRELINQKVDSASHLFIVEDDIVFCSKTQNILQKIIETPDFEWDLLYTDICVPNVSAMIDLFHLKQECLKTDQLRILDLAEMNFASTAAYIVNKKSTRKVATILNAMQHLDTPIDLTYRALVHSGQLKAYVAFPFLTSLSSRSEDSNIQIEAHAYTEAVWHGFRKLIWMDGNVEDIQNNLRQIEAGTFSAEAKALSMLLGGTLSKNYSVK
jgi:GR25 family glycosyltransferase involved in LPS biosynthesis